MRRLASIVAGPLLLVGTGSAAPPDRTAMELVTSLTTEVGPRLAGSANEARARRWAVEYLRRLGFSNVREEVFKTVGWRRGAEALWVVAPSLQPLMVTAFGGSVATPPGGVEATLAYVGSFDALKRLPADALAGRIAFVDSTTPSASRLGVDANAASEDRAAIVSEAAKRGAVAVLLRSAGTGPARFAHTGVLSYRSDAPRIPAGALALPDADQIARLARSLTPVRLRLDLESQDLGPLDSGNVVADLPGSSRSSEIVLISAHLDSWDLGTGALDDGAGVAMVIAAAVRVAREGHPHRTIRVVLFGAEETHLDGGRDYARRHANELARHVIATEADFGAAPIWGFYSNAPNALMPQLERVQTALAPMGVERGHNHASGGEDLYFMRKAGVPVVSLVQDGTHYFDYHHTADDTLDKIDPPALEQNVAAFGAFLRIMANP